MLKISQLLHSAFYVKAADFYVKNYPTSDVSKLFNLLSA